MASELTIGPTGTLMPQLGRCVIDPSGVGSWENQDVEDVTILLVAVGQRIRDVAVLLDLPFHSVRGHALTAITIGAIHNTATTGIRTKPKHAVIGFGN